MRVAISGASGTLGSRLRAALLQRGDEVVSLVRRETGSPDERYWDPTLGYIEAPGLADVDVVVNLAGAPISGSRWSKKYMDTILDSRLDSTETLVEAIGEAKKEGRGPELLLSASAAGHYGPHPGDVALTEDAGAGPGFLAHVTKQWEVAANRARDFGVNVVTLRTGLVLAPEGGMIAALRLPTLAGLIGPVGKGDQWFPWITAEDHVRAMMHLIDEGVAGGAGGPANLASPNPVTNKEFMKRYAHSLGRPAFMPFPTVLAGLVLTPRMVDETLAAGQRALPGVLLETGFQFNQPTLDAALEWLKRETAARKNT